MGNEQNETKQEIKKVRAGIDYVTEDIAEVNKIRTVKKVSGLGAGEFNRKVFMLGLNAYLKSEEFKKAKQIILGSL